MRIAALLLAASLSAWLTASPTSDLLDRVKKAKTVEEVHQALDSAPPELRKDPSIPWESWSRRGDAEGLKEDVDSLLRARDLIAGDEAAAANPESVDTAAKEILSRPVYADDGPAGSRNWVGDAVQEVSDYLANRFSPPEINRPRGLGMGGGLGGVGLIRTVVIVLAVCLLAGLVWAILRFQWGRRKKLARGGGLLDDDEPDRSADEWLTLAEDLARQGDYRRAVRSLYLACLMRFDENGVARFDRSETNWEHLRRIQASSKAPLGIDFQPATLLFDNVWYGQRFSGDKEYVLLRDVYTSLLAALSSGRAA